MTDFKWNLLESSPPAGQRLSVRLADPEKRQDVYIAVDPDFRRYLLLEIPAGEPNVAFERVSAGIHLQTVQLDTDKHGFADFVEIACVDDRGHEALDIIARELINALQEGANIGRVRLVQSILSKWRRFWSGVGSGALSKEKQIGLFGELWFLLYWLAPSVGWDKAVSMWRGPFGSRNDFETKKLAVEVKTTCRVDGVHIVNGLDQLMEPSNGALLFFGLRLREEGSGDVTLLDLIALIKEELMRDHCVATSIESALYAVGYYEEHDLEYAKHVFRVVGQGLYRVSDDFPRITSSSLTNGVPGGVDNVVYEINLDAAKYCLLASNAADAEALILDFSD